MAAVEEPVVQGVQAFSLVELAADRAAFGVVGEVAEPNRVLIRRPYSCRARVSGSLGPAACRRLMSRLAVTVPSRREAAQRTSSSQPSRMRSRLSG